MIKTTIFGWWILLQAMSGYTAEIAIPRAAGPYPSQEMCRIAGNKMMPDDRRFWTEEARVKAEAANKLEAEKRKAQDAIRSKEIEVAAAHVREGKIKPGWVTLSSGDKVHLDKDGKEDVITFGTVSFTSISSPLYTALTPCVEIKEVSK